jgi:hypothetical protein
VRICCSKRFLSEAGEVAYRTTRAVEPFALLSQRLAAGPLPDVLGLDAVAGLTIVVVVVEVRAGRVLRALALEGTGGLPQAVRSRVQEAFLLVHGHAFLLRSPLLVVRQIVKWYRG